MQSTEGWVVSDSPDYTHTYIYTMSANTGFYSDI